MVDWAATKYISFTTFRRDGTPVATPVWVAAFGDNSYGFTTKPESFKVKRLAKDPRVELRPCSMRGAVDPDAPVATGTARVISDGPEHDELAKALGAKYGMMFRFTELGDRFKRTILRKHIPGCAVVIQLDS